MVLEHILGKISEHGQDYARAGGVLVVLEAYLLAGYIAIKDYRGYEIEKDKRKIS